MYLDYLEPVLVKNLIRASYFAISDQNLTVSTGSIILKKVAVASAR